ncbi:PTS sugar transporter subunit IIA [Dethiosulfatarculus sandiegensis]|uniref:PTS sugar transporter n=1 Tax=Dethiosulfatarculus sandiegensis TaxID=1429043 RepID=A0A0D2JRI7_9BACT|nr:PTS sugar transporter subunit IIA [Dethiosulfatarculus sandiegensis]KIX12100.1 PTS sugar transporter [Dethiosulfatarculus sandiegensis]
MIGLIIISHARLASELLSAAEFILGKIKNVEAIDILATTDPDSLEQRLARSVKKLKDPDGVLILTDMFGGTPNNVSCALLEKDKVEVVTGVNLPMMIEAATTREDNTLEILAVKVSEKGQNAINAAGALLVP